jgi:hypothetical protein
MTRGILVSVTQPASRGLMLRRVLAVVGALREVAHQMHYPEEAVAEEQRAG